MQAESRIRGHQNTIPTASGGLEKKARRRPPRLPLLASPAIREKAAGVITQDEPEPDGQITRVSERSVRYVNTGHVHGGRDDDGDADADADGPER